MKHLSLWTGRTRAFVLVAIALGSSTAHAAAQEAQVGALQLRIPESMRVEHEEIHTRLIEATEASGSVGEAARALADVLHPHFVREEEIALVGDLVRARSR